MIDARETPSPKTMHDVPEGAVALNLEILRTDDIAIVRCRGRIVFGEEADELRRVVLELLNETKRIVVSLASVAYLDSSGVDTLVASFISARNRRAEIKLADLSPAVRRVLTSTNVHWLLELHDSTEEAVRSFYPRPEAAAG
jgi:anti-anti-sigma factor